MRIAIIGASNDRSKYGNKIVRDLLLKGHEVFPVNPKEDIIEGQKCYKTIRDLPVGIEVFNIVTPPEVTLEILKIAKEIGFKNIWCQPGSTNDETKRYLVENDFKYIVDSCIMMSR